MADQPNPVSPYDYNLAMQRRASRQRDLESPEGRRLWACRAAGDMRDVIEALPDGPLKNELTNSANLTLRLVILVNDGGPLSPSKLNAF